MEVSRVVRRLSTLLDSLDRMAKMQRERESARQVTTQQDAIPTSRVQDTAQNRLLEAARSTDLCMFSAKAEAIELDYTHIMRLRVAFLCVVADATGGSVRAGQPTSSRCD